MRLKEYLKEKYALYFSKNTYDRPVPESYRAVYSNPTTAEMKMFVLDTGLAANFRWAACAENKTLVIWYGDTEIHERMIEFLKTKHIFPKDVGSVAGRKNSKNSELIAGFAYIHPNGKMEITMPMEAYEWDNYNQTLDWKFLSKYFTNWDIVLTGLDNELE